MARTPYDGEPYYCANCGLGFGEFMACEEPDCLLEDAEVAQERARKRSTEGPAYV